MARKKVEHHNCDCEKTIENDPQLNNNTTTGPLDAILSNIAVTQQMSPGSEERINGIVVGRIVQINETTPPLVDFPENVSGSAVQALSTVVVEKNDTNREVALAFVNGDPRTPVIIGFMHVPSAIQSAEKIQTGKDGLNAVTVEKDGERVTISAKDQIALKCGESSIILTRAGKILLKGAYVSSHAKGMNRIKGGAVQIN